MRLLVWNRLLSKVHNEYKRLRNQLFYLFLFLMIDSLMAKLYFRYGAMNAGKSTALMQVAYNYEERGMQVLILKPATDSK
mgnify:FL=1